MEENLETHQPKYREGSYNEYDYPDIGYWVKNLIERSKHRKDEEKRRKDLQDALNYAQIFLNKAQKEIDLEMRGLE